MLRPVLFAQEISIIVMLLGLLMLFVPLIDIAYGEPPATWFFLLGIAYLLASYACYKFLVSRFGIVEPGLVESMITYSLAWLIVPALAAVALAIEVGMPYVDAFFESVSGFTGTGLTVMSNLERARKGVLFWRGLMQWVGELGFVVFAAIMMPFFWRFGHILYSIERPVRISASLRKSAKKIFYIYSIITLFGILVCMYLGVEPLDAVVHAMTAIATGGMSNYDANYQRVFEYAPLSVYPITALMILGGTSFVVLGYLLSGEFGRAWRNPEFRAYVYLLVFFAATSTTILAVNGYSFAEALLLGGFNAVSALTTTGFSVGSMSTLPSEVRMLYTCAMFIGGMSFATVGGIKVVRLVILASKFKSHVYRMLTGGAVTPDVKLGEDVLDEHEVSGTLLFVILHFFFVLLGAGLIKCAMPDVDLVNALFESASAAGAVGLSTGITSPFAPITAKVTLIVLMYLGRLEYIPLLTLVGVLAIRRYRALAR